MKLWRQEANLAQSGLFNGDQPGLRTPAARQTSPSSKKLQQECWLVSSLPNYYENKTKMRYLQA
ncbi:hypothetical protein ACU8KH_05536 [Lachancea thermotolerans]